ncbi:methyltransferase domain-containing protein [Nitratireductor sp. CAU 1489]|uniref:Methyltransferase domain-containing protein n=1 Tax=Nitratireductor arenosus TaxID=2682096 RepID=A0A844QEV3_9HYPH|nr:class I SAM-dependent methyltransferase [Nitratireductor arenosus]MVA97872.1 methyltransferase domain-containing protein [Nitratireductor arenosus]
MQTSSTHYRDEYDKTLVAQWDELLGWTDRRAAEGSFLADLLSACQVRSVLDTATGTGFHAVLLSQAGFAVTAIDGAAEMVERARRNIATMAGRAVSCAVGDWLDHESLPAGPFDAVICMGNSIAHLFSRADLDRALCNFRRLVRDGGTLVLDHRNYDAILAGRISAQDRTYCCTGLKASVDLAVVGRDVVDITYRTAGHAPATIRTHAWTTSEVGKAIGTNGFDAHALHGPRGAAFDPDRSEFVIHVATAADR